MSRVVTNTGTLTVYPSSYDSTDKSYYSISNVSNAYTEASGSGYCSIGLTRGSGASTYVYFGFNTSSIPQNATITSISCIVRISISNQSASNIASKGAKMCSGTTEKTGAVSVTTTTSNRTFTMGTWTRAELNDIRLKLYATRGTSNTSNGYVLRLYGCTLTIGYTYNDIYYEVTTNSTVPEVTATSSDSEMLSGGDVTVSFTGASITDFAVTDNNVNVTSLLVQSESGYTYTIVGISDDHVVIVIPPPSTGQSIFIKQGGSWVPISTIYKKTNSGWEEVDILYLKQNGVWIN